MAQTEFEECLKILVEKEGSDLYYSTGAPPSAKFYGTLTPLSDVPMKPGEVQQIAESVMNEEQRQQFEHNPEMNLAISRSGLGRYRVNIFKQRNQVSMVIRRLGGRPRSCPSLLMISLGRTWACHPSCPS